MKKIILLIAIISLSVCSHAFAGGALMTPEPLEQPTFEIPLVGYYIGIHAGAAIPNTDGFSTGPDAGAQIGYRGHYFQMEIAGSYLRNHFQGNFFPFRFLSGDLNLSLLMINGVFNFHLFSLVYPYLGGGAGWLHAWVSDSPINVLFNTRTADKFAYQAIAGIGFHITRYMMLNAQYRFVDWTESSGAHINIIEASLDYFNNNL